MIYINICASIFEVGVYLPYNLIDIFHLHPDFLATLALAITVGTINPLGYLSFEIDFLRQEYTT